MTVSIAKGHEVPTISADSCHDVHLHFHEPQGMGSLYTAKCSNVFIHFQPPNLEEQKLALPSADVDSQYITRCSEGKVVSVMAVRGIRFSVLLFPFRCQLCMFAVEYRGCWLCYNTKGTRRRRKETSGM